MSAVNKERSQSIDMVKGLSIMTLFYLHFENGWMNIDYDIFLVRSPAFYIVVGWLWGMSSSKRSIKEHWNKRLKSLVVPYLWLSLLFLLFDLIMILIHQFDMNIFWRDVYKTLCLRGIGTLWFLPALLGGEMLFIYLRDRSWELKIVALIIGFFILVLYRYWLVSNDWIDFDLRNLMNSPFRVVRDICDAFIYIALTYYLSKNFGKRIFTADRKVLFGVGIGLLSISFIIINFLLYPIRGIYEIVFLTANFCAGLGILFFFKSIEHMKIVERPLSYCGRNSLCIMAFHYCLILPIMMAVDKSVFHHVKYCGGYTLIYFFVAVLLQIMIVEVVNRKFKFLIGK